MVFSLGFAHSAADCPAAHKEMMEGFTRLLSAENLRQREIRFLDGYVDKL